jgi:ABC-type transport system involved in multi-copper enzyme maturation permease subunit
MVLLSATAVIGNTVGERENHTLAFAMSLPISYLEYTTSKILGSLLIYVPFWLAIVAACLSLILVSPAIHGLFAFTIIMAVEILVSTCLMIAVALVTESKNWTISAMITGNVALNVVAYLIAHIPAIGNGMWRKVIQWSPTATILLASEFALIALMLGGAFFFQSRKKDFI